MTVSPILTACATDRYDCGHITRSSLRPIKRAVFLYRAEVEGLGFLGGRHEDTATLAALALMRAGSACAAVLVAGGAEADALAASLDAQGVLPTLTPRQVEVLALVSEGASFPEIAADLSISTETVRSLAKAAMRATGTHSVVDAAVEAAYRGLI